MDKAIPRKPSKSKARSSARVKAPREGKTTRKAVKRVPEAAKAGASMVVATPAPKRRGQRAVRLQYGALPYRFSPFAALEILVLTTRETRRWIVPKGWPIRRLKPEKSAAREAWEEAGVRGRIGAKAVGAFVYDKALDETGASVACEVKVFPLQVEQQSDTWPEVNQRIVQWVDPERAIALVKEPGLKALIAAFAKRVAVTAVKAVR